MPTREEIEKLAYSLWEKDGKPEGRDKHYYFEAERRLKEREAAQEGAKAPTPLREVKAAGRPAAATPGAAPARPRRRSAS